MVYITDVYENRLEERTISSLGIEFVSYSERIKQQKHDFDHTALPIRIFWPVVVE